MANPMYGDQYEPNCDYCIHAELTADGGQCQKGLPFHPVADCPEYQYDILKRKPNRLPPELPDYTVDDFKL